MAEMASWFQIDKGYIFLTDEDIIAYYDQRQDDHKSIDWNNMVGHYGIITVFGVPDKYHHHEGFVEMPDVIKKTILDRRMDMMFAHAGNLREATPEFIPLMKRLANRYPHVEEQLQRNPYLCYNADHASFQTQMEIGVQNGFTGSTIGQLLRHVACNDKAMMLALRGARELMDSHSDHHHYRSIIDHANVTKAVLRFILDNIPHKDVQDLALARLKTVKRKAVQKQAVVAEMNIQVLVDGKTKIRTLA
jgi:hypothetical protein